MLDSLLAATKEVLRRLADTWGSTPSDRAKRTESTPTSLPVAPAAAPASDARSSAGSPDQQGAPAAAPSLVTGAPAPTLGNVPLSYGETRIAALPRDPHCLHIYWEATEEALAEARAKLGPDSEAAGLVIRVHDITNELSAGAVTLPCRCVPVDRAQSSCFLEHQNPRSVLRVELALQNPEGEVAVLTRSAAVEMPADSVSQDTRAEWMTVERATALPEAPGNSACATTPADPEAPQPCAYATTPADPEAPQPCAYATTPADPEAPQPCAYATMPADPEAPPHRRELGRPCAHASHAQTTLGSGGVIGDPRRALRFVLGGETEPGARTPEVAMDRVVRWIRSPSGRESLSAGSGPVAIPLSARGPIEVWFDGERGLLASDGWTGALEGPWQVVIKGSDAKGEHRVLDTWQISTELVRTAPPPPTVLGSAHAPAATGGEFVGSFGNFGGSAGETVVAPRSTTNPSDETSADSAEQAPNRADPRVPSTKSEERSRNVQWSLFSNPSPALLGGSGWFGGASEMPLGGSSSFSVTGAVGAGASATCPSAGCIEQSSPQQGPPERVVTVSGATTRPSEEERRQADGAASATCVVAHAC